MKNSPESAISPANVPLTLDAANLFAFVRTLKRRCAARDLGVVVLTVSDGCLAVDTLWGGIRLACNPAATALRARVHGQDFLRIVNMAQNSPLTGHVTMTLGPALGEIALADVRATAAFD